MNTYEAEQLLHMTQGIWPDMPTKTDSADAWAAVLSNLHYEHGRRAVIDIARSSETWPTVAKIAAVARHHASVEAIVNRMRSGDSAPTGDDRQGARCPRDSCTCTHTGGCEAGWIEAEPGPQLSPDTSLPMYDRVRPCATCRPDLAARLHWGANRTQVLAAWREEAKALRGRGA